MIKLKGMNRFVLMGSLGAESKLLRPLLLEYVESQNKANRDIGGSRARLLLCSMEMNGRLKSFGT